MKLTSKKTLELTKDEEADVHFKLTSLIEAVFALKESIDERLERLEAMLEHVTGVGIEFELEEEGEEDEA